MSLGPESTRNYGQPEGEDFLELLGDEPRDTSGILPQEEIDSFVSEVTKGLTPEVVAKIWNRFNKFEKRIVFLSDSEFEKWIEKYQGVLIERGKSGKEAAEKVQVIKSIHKLVQANDPLAARIERSL